MKKFDFSILIILYGKNLHESTTVNSLVNILAEFKNYSVVIWNNGPDVVEKENVGFQYKLINSIDNMALSIIYNRFLYKTRAEKYFFFDDDTNVGSDFINASLSSNSHVILPKVFCDEIQYYPKSIKINGIISNGFYTENDKIVSIGSGICLNDEVLNKFYNEYNLIFDERFKFYGVDSSFFYRLNGLRNVEINVLGSLCHSLSKLTIEAPVKLNFRRRERAIDLALQFRHYKSITVFKSSLKFVLTSILHGRFSLFITYIKSYFLGKHPDI